MATAIRPTVDTSLETLAPAYKFTLTSKKSPKKHDTSSTPHNRKRVIPRRTRSSSSVSTTSSTSAVSPVVSSSACASSANSNASSSPTSATSLHLPIHASEEYVLAMHDFEPQHPNATCLSFRAGQVIHVLNRDESGWWDGELEGRRGWFPSNYVHVDISSLTEEELPRHGRTQPFYPGHVHNTSVMSTASWASTPPSDAYQQSFARRVHPRPSPLSIDEHHPEASYPSADNAYCPPIMVPLLHTLSLLQNAVRSNRPQHFQPSTAYILTSVRSILSETGCLPRDAPILQRHIALAAERKHVLAELAALVNQAKRASGEVEDLVATDNTMRDVEVETMLRMGGGVLAHVRKFLALASQCGINLPGPARRSSSEKSYEPGYDTDGTNFSQNPGAQAADEGDSTFRAPLTRTATDSTPRRAPRVPMHPRTVTATPSRAKSMGDMRARRRRSSATTEDGDSEDSAAPLVPVPQLTGYTKRGQYTPLKSARIVQGHGPSLSSGSGSSMSSSFSTNHSSPPPCTPQFHTGSATTAQVFVAVRHAHDVFLSTIAAFIGHVHSHSRTSHASATGHLYDLVREVVEIVCRLLSIVDAVLDHPDAPPTKAELVRVKREKLYDVISSLADLVRQVTTTPHPSSASDEAALGGTGMSEEDEKQHLLNTATSALKIGGDCMSAVTACLHRIVGDTPFVIQLGSTDVDEASSTISQAITVKDETVPYGTTGDASIDGMRLSYYYEANDSHGISEEEATIHVKDLPPPPAPSPLPISSSSSSDIDSIFSKPSAFIFSDADSSATLPMTANTSAASVSVVRDTSGKPILTLQMPTGASSTTTTERFSPSSARTDDEDMSFTTWEGTSAQRCHIPPGSSDKELPSVPRPSGEENVMVPVEQKWPSDHAEEDIAKNSEKVIVGATLQAIVERMTPHDAIHDPVFSAVFWLTFRLFSSPSELVQLLIARYNIVPPPDLPQEATYVWQQQKGIPTRLRVSNFIKLWLETYWKVGDNVVLPALRAFVRDALSLMFPTPSQRILDLIDARNRGFQPGAVPSDRSRDTGMPINPPRPSLSSEIPRPSMTKTLLAALRSANFESIVITDFDAVELARQMTIMECNLYCAIPADEVMTTGQEGAPHPVHVRAVTSLSTVITGWITESILNEGDTKKRTLLVKFFIKVADRCTTLHNYSTPRAILAALDSSTISRLHQTWLGLPQKSKVQFDSLRKLADHARNYHEYRSRLRNTSPPAVPFLGLYLTDVTFCREGNPSHRASPLNPDKKLINYNKYHKLARIVQDMQRFQVPYNLKEIVEVQQYLNFSFEKCKNHGDLQDLYRRSLLVEPRHTADIATTPLSDVRQLFNWGNNRSQPATALSAS